MAGLRSVPTPSFCFQDKPQPGPCSTLFFIRATSEPAALTDEVHHLGSDHTDIGVPQPLGVDCSLCSPVAAQETVGAMDCFAALGMGPRASHTLGTSALPLNYSPSLGVLIFFF